MYAHDMFNCLTVTVTVTVTERQVDGVYNAAQRYTHVHMFTCNYKLSLGTFVLLCVI